MYVTLQEILFLSEDMTPDNVCDIAGNMFSDKVYDTC